MAASAARKLEKEIQVALKKVDDGIEEFDYVWEQATSNSNNSQKEKLGEELKKSINKLQRLRVQIREWISASDVKNNFKDKLETARKLIENDMKRFKEFERDMKTKTFSACALAKEDELDLEEAEKRKSQEWLVGVIQTLNEQLEEFEADLEALTNKKSLGGDDKDRQTQIKTQQERHQWHSKKLELLLRALDNDAVDVTDLAIVRESVEVYIDMQEDMDYPHDETLYDCFSLAEYEAAAQRTPNADGAQDGGTPGSKEEPKQKTKEKEKRKKDDKKEKKKDDKKAGAVTTPQAAGGSSNKAGGSSVRSADAKAPSAAAEGGKDEKQKIWTEVEEECKVQAEQLLLGGEAEEFVCKICQTHVVGCGPTLTNCSHLFCGDCLGQWFAAHPDSQTWAQRAKAAGPDRVVPCPVCKQPLNEKRDLYPVCGATSRSENLLLWRMLSSLKIMCQNHTRMRPDGKCDWIGEYGQYQKHIATCERMHESGGAASPAAAPVLSVAALVPPAAPVRAPSEPRRPDDTQGDHEKSSAYGAGAPEQRSPHGAAAVAPAAAKLPVAKPDHSPKALQASSSPHAAAPQQAARMPVGVTKSPVAAASLTAQETKPTSGAFLLPVADEGHGDIVEASAPAAPVKVQLQQAAPSQAPVVAAVPQPQPAQLQPQLQQHSQPQAQQPQPRKAASPAQEPDGSFITQATSAFEPTGPNMVPAQIGDTIHVLERHQSGWTYCKNLSVGGNTTGWAPSWIVQPAAADEASRQKEASRKQAEASALSTTPTPFLSAASQESPLLAVQQAANKAELHRSTQPAVAAAPTPQHGTQAVPLAPKASSTVVRVATAGFAGSSASQLTVNMGDLVEIVESHASGWTYGRKVHTPQHAASFAGAVEGWFPDWVCAQK